MKYFYLTAFCFVFFNQTVFGGIVETFHLNNGVKVIHKQTNTADIVSLKIYSPVSVLHEDTSRAGITSLLHNVMNKSTKNRNAKKLAEDIENLGASVSCDVEYDFSGFSLNCMSLYFNRCCDILSDIILNPGFDEEEIEKEKNLLIQVIKSRSDSITETATDKFISDFFGNHPYSYAKYGKIETLQNITREDLIAFYDKIYSSKGIVITVVGNISKSALKKTLEKYFCRLNSVNECPKPADVEKAERNAEDVVVNSKFNQAFVIYAYDAPNVYNKDFAALKLLNVILGGRMTGRLFVELREKLGLAYEVSSVYPTRIQNSYFEIYIGLDKKNIDVAKKGIEKIMNDLRSLKIGETELENTKNFIKGVYLLDHQTVEKQAYYLAFREVTGVGYEYDQKYINYLSEVTSEDIINCVNKYFKSEPYKLIMIPEK